MDGVIKKMIDNELVERVTVFEGSLDTSILSALESVSREDEAVVNGFKCIGALRDYEEWIDNDEYSLCNEYKDLLKLLKDGNIDVYERLWVWQCRSGVCVVTCDNGNGYCDYCDTLGKMIINFFKGGILVNE